MLSADPTPPELLLSKSKFCITPFPGRKEHSMDELVANEQ